MNTDPQNLERRLSEPVETPEPPKDLADRIRAEIPDLLPRPSLPLAEEESSAPRWRIAAMLAVGLVAGSLTWWVSQEVPMAPESVSEEQAAPAGQRAEAKSKEEVPQTSSEAALEPEAEKKRADLVERMEELKRRARTTPKAPDELSAAAPRPIPQPMADREVQSGDRDQMMALNEPEVDSVLADSAARPADDRAAKRMRPSPPPPPSAVASPDPSREAPSENSSIQQENAEIRSLSAEQSRLEEELRGLEGGRADRNRQLAESKARRTPPVEEPPSSNALQALGYAAPRVADDSESEITAPPSTGGTAEPNGQPHGDMFFQHSGVNPFLDPAEDAQSTFSLDVDRASFTMLRSYLAQGHRPPQDSVRVEEIVNALDAGGAEAPADRALHWTVEGAPTPFIQGPDYRLVRFHMASRPVVDRPAAALTLLVDVSGSMAQGGRIELVRRSLGLLLDGLRPGDRVSLVTFGQNATVLIQPTEDLAAVRAALRKLSPGGSTHAAAGLEAAYELALRTLRPGAVNRVILCSDGVANTGETDGEALLERLAAGAESGIELTALGFGMGNYNDVLLEKLANRGDGNYAYIDSLAEAKEVLGTQLGATLVTVAEDARVQVDFDPALVERYRLLGYENRDLPDEDFRNTASDGGEIGAGHRVTALYEIKLRPAAFESSDALATLRFRYRDPASREWIEQDLPLRARDLAPSWRAASPQLRQAALAAELAEILRGSYWAREGSLAEVARRARALAQDRPGDTQAAELASLAERAAGL